jgi:hypothetical protein
MRFRYEWDEPELARACYDLERRQVIERYWRRERRQASLAVALVATPLLVALLALSLVLLVRARVSGLEVVAVFLAGGLVGGLLVALRGLGARAVRRRPPKDWPPGLALVLLWPLASGGVVGALSAAVLLVARGSGASFRPQTLYLIALAAALALDRVLGRGPRSIVSST